MAKLPSPTLRPGSSVKSNIPSSSSNLSSKIEKAKASSPSGTTGGAGGISGSKGSQQATGGGTTQIIANLSGAQIVSSTPENIKAIESSRQQAQSEQRQAQIEGQKQADIRAREVQPGREEFDANREFKQKERLTIITLLTWHDFCKYFFM
jgi:hypothetical protein